MTAEERNMKLMEALNERQEAEPGFVTGIPGYVQAAMVAPDCVLICDERVPGFPIVFCLN